MVSFVMLYFVYSCFQPLASNFRPDVISAIVTNLLVISSGLEGEEELRGAKLFKETKKILTQVRKNC